MLSLLRLHVSPLLYLHSEGWLARSHKKTTNGEPVTGKSRKAATQAHTAKNRPLVGRYRSDPSPIFGDEGESQHFVLNLQLWGRSMTVYRNSKIQYFFVVGFPKLWAFTRINKCSGLCLVVCIMYNVYSYSQLKPGHTN